jgi:hypothetical protein
MDRRATALPTRSSGRAATLARHLCLLTPSVSASSPAVPFTRIVYLRDIHFDREISYGLEVSVRLRMHRDAAKRA